MHDLRMIREELPALREGMRRRGMLGVLDDIGLAILLDDEADGLVGSSLPDNFRSNVNVLGGGEADEYGIRDFDQAVVNAVGVDVLNASFAHVGARFGEHECLIDTAVTVRCDGDS